MPVTLQDNGRNSQIDISPDVMSAGNARIEITGRDCRLTIGPGTRLPAGLIELRNDRAHIVIGARCMLSGQFRLRAADTRLIIGDETTMMGGQISLHETGTIRLGRDCMLSGDIRMDVSDMHSILDASSGQRINPPADIEIGEHVWIAQGVQLLKGTVIGHDSVIGARALVSGQIPPGSLAAGVPARVLRPGITWDRRRLPSG